MAMCFLITNRATGDGRRSYQGNTDMKRIALVLAAGLLSSGLFAGDASAGDRRSRYGEPSPQLSEHPNSRYYRGQGPQVRGYVKRRGGYSYNYSDSIIDYRDTSILRDYQTSRTQGGPFDSGFFFDSGNTRQNDSPYLN